MALEHAKPGGSDSRPDVWSDDGLLDQIDIPIYAVNARGECRRFNRAAEKLFGYSQNNVLGRNMHDLLHSRRADGSAYPQAECTLLRVSGDGHPIRRVRETMWSGSGEALPVECSVAGVLMDGEPGVVITAKDLRPQHRMEASLEQLHSETTELLRQRDAASKAELELATAASVRQRELTTQVEQAATDKLREQQELLDHVVRAAPIGIVVLDAAFRFRWLNRAYTEMMRNAGCATPVAGDSFLEVISATREVEQLLYEVRATGKPFMEVAFPYDALPNGRTYWNWSLTPLPSGDILMMTQNVTEQTLANQALVESDKMAAVGRLAASISHEINNPLEAVTNLLYLVHQDPTLSADSSGYIEIAEEELSRVSRIASQTLRFHRHAPNAVPRTASQLIDPVLALYAGKLKSAQVNVTVDSEGAQPVMIHEGDVRQILNNLIGNAIDAMERGGDIHVKMRSMHCKRTGRPGIRITIADTGHGMPPETVAHVFEPFYTTKGAAGSGLGLWISHTLAERHGGKLQVKSRQATNAFGHRAGTAFSLFLPSQEQPAVPAATIQ